MVKSLEASLWAFHDAETFEEAVLRAVNLGDDADTTGADLRAVGRGVLGRVGHPSRCGLAWQEWTCWKTPWRGLLGV